MSVVSLQGNGGDVTHQKNPKDMEIISSQLAKASLWD